MFEARKRAATARSGRLSEKGWNLETPNVLGVESERFPAFVHSDAVMEGGEEWIIVKVLEEGEGIEGFRIPPYSGVPATSPSRARKPREPRVEGRVCVIRSDTPSSDIVALRKDIDIFVMENALELYQNTRRWVDQLVRIREAAGYQSALYLPGVALPTNLATLVYTGADLVDASRTAYLSTREYFLTCDGSWKREELKGESCSCAACVDAKPGRAQLLRHNMLALYSELHRVRARIARGDLREFVEYRAKTSPKLVEIVRHMDKRFQPHQERRFPIIAGRFRATTRLSVERPDVVRFRNRILNRYSKPPTPSVLLLLPCSARKPYSESKSHGLFRKAIADSGGAIGIHQMIVTSPLGLVPRDLELFYPARHYDIPVTGHWYEDERVMVNGMLAEYVKLNHYDAVINHVDEGLITSVDAVCTLSGKPTSDESLENLGKVLHNLTPDPETKRWKARTLEELESVAAFQYGTGAKGLFEGCVVKGRFPKLRVLKDKEDVASLSPVTGQLIPTMKGADLLAPRNLYCVNIYDFEIEGNLFAVGVESASPEIRVGDEVVIRRKGEAVATGMARMNGEEMTESERGEAVRIRFRK